MVSVKSLPRLRWSLNNSSQILKEPTNIIQKITSQSVQTLNTKMYLHTKSPKVIQSTVKLFEKRRDRRGQGLAARASAAARRRRCVAAGARTCRARAAAARATWRTARAAAPAPPPARAAAAGSPTAPAGAHSVCQPRSRPPHIVLTRQCM